jgi:hypothetical protein
MLACTCSSCGVRDLVLDHTKRLVGRYLFVRGFFQTVQRVVYQEIKIPKPFSAVDLRDLLPVVS